MKRRGGLFKPVRACITPMSAVDSTHVTTNENRQSPEATVLRETWAFVDVALCGYCKSGQLMSVCALLKKTPQPGDSDIDAGVSGKACRCGIYQRTGMAIHQAAKAHRWG